jgi:hypothetical protein
MRELFAEAIRLAVPGAFGLVRPLPPQSTTDGFRASRTVRRRAAGLRERESRNYPLSCHYYDRAVTIPQTRLIARQTWPCRHTR